MMIFLRETHIDQISLAIVLADTHVHCSNIVPPNPFQCFFSGVVVAAASLRFTFTRSMFCLHWAVQGAGVKCPTMSRTGTTK